MHISSEAHDERVDLLLEEIAESEDAAERSTLLLDLADLLDRGLGDPERALRSAQDVGGGARVLIVQSCC